MAVAMRARKIRYQFAPPHIVFTSKISIAGIGMMDLFHKSLGYCLPETLHFADFLAHCIENRQYGCPDVKPAVCILWPGNHSDAGGLPGIKGFP